MKKLMLSVLLILGLGNLLAMLAQDVTHTGFAVVTVLNGNVSGLVATENLINKNGVTEQTVVAPSVLLTNASVLVPVGPIAENTTAIAIANPSLGSGGVNLILTDANGAVVSNTTFLIGPRGQLSKYINELFSAQGLSVTTPLLLTITSEIPVAILPLNFRGGSFSPIPLTSLSFATPVPVQTLAPPLPTTITTSTVTAIGTTTGVTPGFGLGLPPTLPQPTTSAFVTRPPATSPVIATPTIGGGSSLTFAQVAVGGGWSSEITLGNTSSAAQSVRVDFFRADGIATSSLENIVIPARGVFFISSDLAANAVAALRVP